MLIKILPFFVPILIFLFRTIIANYLKSIFNKRDKNIGNDMIMCDKCGVYFHESFIVKKNNLKLCSKECSSA
jgi:hypothetical protein